MSKIRPVSYKLTKSEQKYLSKVRQAIFSPNSLTENMPINMKKYLNTEAKDWLATHTEDSFVKYKMKPERFKLRNPEPPMTTEEKIANAKKIYKERVENAKKCIEDYAQNKRKYDSQFMYSILAKPVKIIKSAFGQK